MPSSTPRCVGREDQWQRPNRFVRSAAAARWSATIAGASRLEAGTRRKRNEEAARWDGFCGFRGCFAAGNGSAPGRASLALPVPRLAFGDPLDRGLEPACAGRGLLRLAEPFHVLAPGAGAETFERGLRAAVLRECGLEIGGNHQRRLWLRLRALVADAVQVQLHRLTDIAGDDTLRGQLGDLRDPSELSPRLLWEHATAGLDQFVFPEAKRAVLLERGHA